MPAYFEDLGDGLVLRSIRDENDIERYVTFQYNMFHNRECTTVYRLLKYHPEITYDDFLYVEDKATNNIISTTCFIPWHVRYEQTTLKAAQLEVVATDPNYRRRGLIRTQIKHFHQMAEERGYHLNIIGGIPFYYRQFGYTYAIEQSHGHLIPPFVIPQIDPQILAHYQLRPTNIGDASLLKQLYDQAMSPLDINDQRDLNFWSYLLNWGGYTASIIEKDGYSVGYLSIEDVDDGNAVWVSENGILDYEAVLAALHLIQAEKRRDIIVGGPECSVLAQLANRIGAIASGTYQWLLRFCNLQRVFRQITPVLEKRLSASAFTNYNGEISINNYTEALSLVFRDGHLFDIRSLGFKAVSNDSDGGDIIMPPDALLRFILGFRNISTLRDTWPDIVIKPEKYLLAETLFPVMSSFLFLPYSYRGKKPTDVNEAMLRTPNSNA